MAQTQAQASASDSRGAFTNNIVVFLCAWPASERQWSQQQPSAAGFQSIRHSMHLDKSLPPSPSSSTRLVHPTPANSLAGRPARRSKAPSSSHARLPASTLTGAGTHPNDVHHCFPILGKDLEEPLGGGSYITICAGDAANFGFRTVLRVAGVPTRSACSRQCTPLGS